MLRNHLPPVMNTSAWVGRSAPPDSTRLMSGIRFSRAMSWARSDLARVTGLEEPPRVVGSLPEITHSTPDTTPIPETVLPPSG